MLGNKKTASKFKPGDKRETPVLDQRDSERAALNSWNNGDKPGKKLTDNADKDSD